MANLQLIGGTMQLPSNVVTNDSVSSSAAIGVSKQQHLHLCGTGFGFAIGGTPTTLEVPVHVTSAVGTVRAFRCGLEETGSSTSIAFDLKKYNAGNPGGVSVLSAAVTITDATTDRAMQAGTISAATTAVNDWYTILMTVSSSTGATGPWAEVEFDEPAA